MTLDMERMRAAYPETPAMVKKRVRQTLAKLNRESMVQPPKRYARRLSFAVMAILTATLVTVAVAASVHFGVFEFMTKMFGQNGVLPEAEELIQQNLGSLKLEHTALEVEEAVYDGGILHVVYAIKQNDAVAPLTAQDVQDPQSRFNQVCAADQALSTCDSFFLNGTEYGMTNGSTADTMIGSNDGELLCYLGIQLASAGIVPDGDFTVQLPVAGGNGVYQTLDFPVKNTGIDRLPVVWDDANTTVTLQSVFVSPVRIYANIHVEMKPEATLWQASETFCDWAEAELVDAKGNKLASLTEIIPQNIVEGKQVDYSYTFLPVDAGEIYLAPTCIDGQGNWGVDMTRALPLQ